MAETIPAPPSRRPVVLRADDGRPLTRALVIDRDQETLSFAAEALSSFTPGLEVATAHDLQQASAWVESFRPQIIFVSEALAVGTLQCLDRRVDAGPALPRCEVVLMRGRDGDDPVIETDPMRFALVLPKPLQLQPLLGAVRAILKTRDDH